MCSDNAATMETIQKCFNVNLALVCVCAYLCWCVHICVSVFGCIRVEIQFLYPFWCVWVFVCVCACVCVHVQCMCLRTMEDTRWLEKAKKIQHLSDCNDTHSSYDAIKAL